MNLPELGQYVGWFGGCVYLLSRAEGALKAWSNRRKLDRLLAGGGPQAARSMKPPEPFRPHHVVTSCTGCGARVVASHFNGAHCEAPWPEDLGPEPLTLAPPVHGHRAAPPLSRMRRPKRPAEEGVPTSRRRKAKLRSSVSTALLGAKP